MDEPRQGNGPVTREKLIEAAGEIFAEKGLYGASIRDITQRAGANIASVNYHFHDKFELYALVLRQAHQGAAAAMNQPLSAASPEGRIRQLLSVLLTSAFDPSRPKWHRRLLGRELLEPTPALDLMQDLMQRPSQRLRELVREIRPDLSEQQLVLSVSGVVAQCLFHLHHGHLVRRMFPKVPEPTLQALIEHVVEFSLAALKGLPAGSGQNRRGRRPTPVRRSPGVSRRRSARNAG
jgi:TetR/AcrR family transcriptional regulator, regulator of cefoperazone and chloramphenicol sensitivity